MKTSKQIIIFFICSLGGIVSACANAEFERAKIDGHDIYLNINKCEYSIDGGDLKKFNLSEKCYFIRNNITKDIAYSFEKDIRSNVILIVGESVTNNPDFPLTKIRKDCGSQLQALILPKEGKPKLSKVIKETITCAGIGVDKKEFWIISH